MLDAIRHQESQLADAERAFEAGVAARQAAEIRRRLRSWRRNDGLGLWHPTHRRGPAFEYPHRQCHAPTADPMSSYIDADEL